METTENEYKDKRTEIIGSFYNASTVNPINNEEVYMDHYSLQWLDDNYIAMRKAIEANSVTRRATSIGDVHNSAGESYYHIIIPTELNQEYKGERFV